VRQEESVPNFRAEEPVKKPGKHYDLLVPVGINIKNIYGPGVRTHSASLPHVIGWTL
jgi:hypothetical protein